MLYLLILSVLELVSPKVYSDSVNLIKIHQNTTVEKKKQSLKWVQTLQKIKADLDKTTKTSVEESEKKETFSSDYPVSKHSTHSNTELYVFVSLSMPKPALTALNQEAREVGATVVLRGLKDNSYQKTASYLQEIIAKTGQGFLIHPELFKRYDIHQVPAIVLTTNSLEQKPTFDVVSGHIPIKTALLKIAEQGELAFDAKDWLQRNAHED